MTHPEQLEHYINLAQQLEIDIAEREEDLSAVLAWLKERAGELSEYERVALTRLQHRRDFSE